MSQKRKTSSETSQTETLTDATAQSETSPSETSTASDAQAGLAGIEYPGHHDVKLGRGGDANSHIGNIKFRQLINQYKPRYTATTRSNKPFVAEEVVQIWRNLDPPGRFLIRTDPSLGDDSTWHDVGDKRARKKASQALREKERSEDLVATLAHSHGGIPGAASAVTASSAAGAASAAANANQNAGVDTINSRKRAKKQQFQPPTQVPPPAAAAIAAALPDATRHVAAGQQEVPLVDPMVAAQLLNLIAGGNLNQNQLPQLNSPPAPVPAPQPQRSALDPMLHSTLQLLAAANQNQNRFQTYGQDRLLASQLLENLGIRMNAQPTEQQGQQQSRNQTQ